MPAFQEWPLRPLNLRTDLWLLIGSRVPQPQTLRPLGAKRLKALPLAGVPRVGAGRALQPAEVAWPRKHVVIQHENA